MLIVEIMPDRQRTMRAVPIGAFASAPDVGAEALGRRSKAWADFVMKALSEFVKMIPNITPPKASSYVHYALAELRCAASDHFKSVNSIIKVFECLFHGSPAPAATGQGGASSSSTAPLAVVAVQMRGGAKSKASR